MVSLMQQAYDLGVTLLDTAECYTGKNPDGSTAYNEELVHHLVGGGGVLFEIAGNYQDGVPSAYLALRK